MAACPAGSGLVPELARVRIELRAAPLGGALNLRARGAIAALLATTRPDVALVTTADEWVWSCLSRGGNPRTRLVLARHMALPLSWRVRWLATRRAHAVIAVSQAVRASLLGRAGIPPARVHVIYNPVRFPPRSAVPTGAERAAARRALAVPADGLLVGFFGGLDSKKGIADVAAAVARANQALRPTRLLLCGRRANAAESSQALAARFALDGRLHDLGETDRMEDALCAADLVVMATHRRLSEALPATLIEAMACGTPVLGYATGGMREVIGRDGDAGWLAAPDDPADLARVLIDALRDRDHAARLAAAGLERVRALFDPHQAADRYEQLFASLCAALPAA